ncbi:MAG: Single-stranded DNA-binding protein [Phycisphaerae bacterium]|nr:Single-stranded DNA-binding protein [Phycisphaerae bacterium]
MANFNRVILAGNLTRDPQLSYLPSNTPVVELGLAINRRWKANDGQMRDETCFVDCVAYGRTAETMNQYLSKGRPVMVEGRLRYRQWEAQDGGKRSKLEVIVENFQFLEKGQREEGAAPRGSAAPSARNMGRAAPPPESMGDEAMEAIPPDSDIPF